MALRKAEAGIYEADRIPLFTQNHRNSGGKSSLSDYYTAAYGAAVFDKSPGSGLYLLNIILSRSRFSPKSISFPAGTSLSILIGFCRIAPWAFLRQSEKR